VHRLVGEVPVGVVTDPDAQPLAGIVRIVRVVDHDLDVGPGPGGWADEAVVGRAERRHRPIVLALTHVHLLRDAVTFDRDSGY
jgi:hypothetical protein